MASPRVIQSLADITDYRRQLAKAGRRLGLVPTMGCLHEGHLSLLRLIQDRCDVVGASIFVNQLQFGPREDFARYPRNMERDLTLLAETGCQVVFNPGAAELYPDGFQTTVEVAEISRPLCGQYRPGHFRGVATVVLKLFNITGCSVAAFGLKDYQQAMVIKQMVRDLNLNVELLFGETVRESDGLAMSSRNSYLSPDERQRARAIPQSLFWARDAVSTGEIDTNRLRAEILKRISSVGGLEPQYVEFVHPESLTPVASVAPRAVLTLAVYAGKTRLIDNILLEAPGRPKPSSELGV